MTSARSVKSTGSPEPVQGTLRRLLPCLMAIAAALVVFPAYTGSLAPPPCSIIHAGQLLAEPGKSTVRDAAIVVEKGVIKEIRPGYAGASALGLPPQTPGFIDLHVHLSSDFAGTAI